MPWGAAEGEAGGSLRCTSWNFLINTLHSSWTRNRLKCNLVSAYVTGRWILYQLSHEGSPKIPEWVALQNSVRKGMKLGIHLWEPEPQVGV